jgi:colanic acid/amylovoran biosynthesis glycosyltransferase
MKLHLFTANYPTGFGESFLNNELPIVAGEFSKVIIYPFQEQEVKQKDFQNQHEVIPFNYKKLKLNLREKIYLISILIAELINISASQKIIFIKKIRWFYAKLKMGYLVSKWLEKENINPHDAYYSFWMNEWALALAILKKKGKINQFVFRINGYDIYDERHEGNYLPFRHFIYKYASRVFPLSKSSEAYVKSKTRFKDKITYSYFGTKDFGIARPRTDKIFTVFSCSSAIPLKRLNKIAEVLCCLKVHLKWVHHGNGETIKDVINILSKKGGHIEFTWSENVADYNEVIKLQQKLAPNVFINLSSTEGLPVSVLEALSLGTPVLLNNVGSCAEIINSSIGIVVESNATPEEIAEKMVNFIPPNNHYKRMAIREYWEQNFSANKNYKLFARELKNIFE